MYKDWDECTWCVRPGLGSEIGISGSDSVRSSMSFSNEVFTSVTAVLNSVQLLPCTYIEYVSMWCFILFIVVHDRWFRSCSITSLSSFVPDKWTVLKYRRNLLCSWHSIGWCNSAWSVSLFSIVLCTNDPSMLLPVAIVSCRLDNKYYWVFANRSRCRINDIRYLIGLSSFVVLTTVRYHIGLSVLFTVRYHLGLSWYFYLQFNVHTYVEVRSLAGLSPPPRIQYVLYG